MLAIIVRIIHINNVQESHIPLVFKHGTCSVHRIAISRWSLVALHYNTIFYSFDVR